MEEYDVYERRLLDALTARNGSAGLSELIDQLVHEYAVPLSEAMTTIISTDFVHTDHMNGRVSLERVPLSA